MKTHYIQIKGSDFEFIKSLLKELNVKFEVLKESNGQILKPNQKVKLSPNIKDISERTDHFKDVPVGTGTTSHGTENKRIMEALELFQKMKDNQK